MHQLFGTKASPKGPNFNQARKLAYDFFGNKLEFSSPPNSLSGYSDNAVRKMNNYNDYSNKVFIDSLNKLRGVNNTYNESWAFFGLPIIDGILGHVTFTVSISESQIDDSIFNKEFFEDEILQVIDNEYSPFSFENTHLISDIYEAPVNWTPVILNNIEWVRYDMIEKKGFESIRIYATPLSDNQYLRLNFIISERHKEQYCLPAMTEFIKLILKSVTVELSPESLKQKEDAESLFPDQYYSKFKHAFEWPEFETMKPLETIFEKVKQENKERVDDIGSFKA